MNKTLDYHVHSKWSLDSVLNVDEAIRFAENMWVNEIAFTEHLDFGFPEKESAIINIPEYIDDLKIHQTTTNIKILKGIEVGITESNLRESQRIISNFDFDFVIASVHANDIVPFCSTKAKLYYGDRLLETYLKHVLYVVKNFDNFNTLGHLDYLLRYQNFSISDLMSFKTLVDEILGTLIYKNKAIEINTKGYTEDNFRDFKPVLERFCLLGGKWITFGSDAHKSASIVHYFSETKTIINELGILDFAKYSDDRWSLLNY
ncbi:MAG: histidinol-phosphatase HisJ family protein [Caldisericia bacterium]|nr:histidinol-phosphatase HisJ family protein [Caldisericia bacterium]